MLKILKHKDVPDNVVNDFIQSGFKVLAKNYAINDVFNSGERIIVIEPDDLDNMNLSGQENSKYKLAYLDENKQ